MVVNDHNANLIRRFHCDLLRLFMSTFWKFLLAFALIVEQGQLAGKAQIESHGD